MIGLIIIPLLSLGLYLGFASYNSRYVTLSTIAIWGIAALAFGGLVYLAVYKLSKNPNTRTLIGCIIVISFYSYGYLSKALGSTESDLTVSLTLCCYILGLILITMLVRHLKLSNAWRLPLSMFVVASLVYPLTSIVIPPNTTIVVPTESEAIELDRDIYIVVLDRYARADMLEKYFDFDNTFFLDELRARGFQVAEESRTNYATTYSSFASMLNMQYLDVLLPDISSGEESRTPLHKLISNNRIKNLIGDDWLTIESWWKGIQDTEYILGGEYPANLLNSTLLQPTIYFWDKYQQGKYVPGETKEMTETGVRLYTKDWAAFLLHYQFGHLYKLAGSPVNYFLVAHIISPHPPYTFDAEGNTPDSTLPNDVLYLGQLQYTNKLVLEWLDTVPSDAIVVLMSDEGVKGISYPYGDAQIIGEFSSEELLEMHSSILMAVRGFDIYPSITPINMMRILANTHLGMSLELLEDRSFCIPDANYPYKYEEISK